MNEQCNSAIGEAIREGGETNSGAVSPRFKRQKLFVPLHPLELWAKLQQSEEVVE